MRTTALFLIAAALMQGPARAASPAAKDEPFAEYFERETTRIEASSPLARVTTPSEWDGRRPEWRRQLREMLGLEPLPERTDLRATVTGTLDAKEFTVEKIHFQSRPGLYVTANLYVPKDLARPAPAVLYVCGHGEVKRDGVAYGNKVKYQHHAIRLAREGIVCLVIDTLQLGEIEGVHHGTHRMGMWWWVSRGYTPAGVEAWNGIRALDYLQSRRDVVDPDRLGIAGRSGGGAYSWFVAALDDRVKAAVPTAGITDLRNHVVDGVIAGHCDCMFPINTYRWDFPQIAALAAPRAVLFQNTDKDRIFPLDGVLRVYGRLRRVYDVHEAGERLGPTIGVGNHEDTPELQVAEIRWLKRHLLNRDKAAAESPVEFGKVPVLEPAALKVFKELPADATNARAHETFVPVAPTPAVPASAEEWARLRDGYMRDLAEKVFRGWPVGDDVPPLDVKRADSRRAPDPDDAIRSYDFTSQTGARLRLHVARPPARSGPPERVVLRVLDDAPHEEIVLDRLRQAVAQGQGVVAFMTPRGVAAGKAEADARAWTHVRRRYVLLGQTLESMQAWDVRRAVQALRALPGDDDAAADDAATLAAAPLWLQAEGQLAGVALYASLFEPNLAGLELRGLPASHREGPHFLNVLRVLDMPVAVALAAERSPVRLTGGDPKHWEFATETARRLGWVPGRIHVTRAVDAP